MMFQRGLVAYRPPATISTKWGIFFCNRIANVNAVFAIGAVVLLTTVAAAQEDDLGRVKRIVDVEPHEARGMVRNMVRGGMDGTGESLFAQIAPRVQDTCFEAVSEELGSLDKLPEPARAPLLLRVASAVGLLGAGSDVFGCIYEKALNLRVTADVRRNLLFRLNAKVPCASAGHGTLVDAEPLGVRGLVEGWMANEDDSAVLGALVGAWTMTGGVQTDSLPKSVQDLIAVDKELKWRIELNAMPPVEARHEALARLQKVVADSQDENAPRLRPDQWGPFDCPYFLWQKLDGVPPGPEQDALAALLTSVDTVMSEGSLTSSLRANLDRVRVVLFQLTRSTRSK
ncbi:MAG: hypothetical protein AB7O52_05580 [Planctomycetota bacterium]